MATNPNMFPGNKLSEVILLTPIQFSLASIQTLVSLSINYTLTGGTFSASILSGNIPTLPLENSIITMPNGRIGVVKSVGSSYTSGGLVDNISGVLLPLQATLADAFTSPPGELISFAEIVNNFQGGGASWQTGNYQIKNFSYRGTPLGGITQVAGYMLAEVIVRIGSISVVDPGGLPQGSNPFAPSANDLVSFTQVLDFSQDQASILNPAIVQVNFIDDGDFIYDSDHAQKQPKTTVQVGAPGAQGSTDFIPIPDGWLVDGNFEEWTPADSNDLTNPSASPTNGRYWKVFRSPTNPSMLRGITNFTRLVKQISIPKNISTFVGSPISGTTGYGTGGFGAFQFANPGVQNGISGFNALPVQLFDVISNQFLDIPNALVLSPGATIDSGFAASNFWSVLLELWMFPRVNPTVFPEGNPTNPFNIPRGVYVVSPNTSVANGAKNGYYQRYLANYKKINSPRIRTNLTCVYRGLIPQPGDILVVPSFPRVRYQINSRISSVSINFGRQGLTLSIVAEQYQATSGLWNNASGGGFSE